jgi:hypothetical protein
MVEHSITLTTPISAGVYNIRINAVAPLVPPTGAPAESVQAGYLDWIKFGGSGTVASASARPRFLRATSGGDGAGTVKLTWRDYAYDETGFNVYRSETPDVDDDGELIGTADPTSALTQTFTDTSAAGSPAMYYSVKAVRDDLTWVQESARSNIDRGQGNTRSGLIQAGTVDETFGVPHWALSPTDVNAFHQGARLRYRGVDFGTDATHLAMQIAFASEPHTSQSQIDVWIDGYDTITGGTKIGTFNTFRTGWWNNTREIVRALDVPVNGVHDVFLIGAAPAGQVARIDWLQFEPERQAPRNLNWTAIGAQSISLTWDQSTVYSEEGFFVQFWPTASGPPGTIRYTGVNETTLTISDLTPYTEYTYRVSAFNQADGTTAPSDPLKVRFLPPPTIGTPQLRFGSITANWTPVPLSNETLVEMWDEDLDEWVKKYQGSESSVTVDGLDPGTTYRFRFKAIDYTNSGYYGDWSAEYEWTTTTTPKH